MICGIPLCGPCAAIEDDMHVCQSCAVMTEQDDSLDLRLCRKCGKCAYMRKDGCINSLCELYYMHNVEWRPKKRGKSSSDWQPEAFDEFANHEGFARTRKRNKGIKRRLWWAERCMYAKRPTSSAAQETPFDEHPQWAADAPMRVNSSDEEEFAWPTDDHAGDPMNRAPITPPAARAQQGPQPAANQAPPTVDQEDC